MYLPFTFPALAAFIDAVRLSPSYGPSCLNLYEEVNADRPRRVGFDLEYELCHELRNGERDHELRAASLWPADFRAVARQPEHFLKRILVDRVLPALNAMAGSHLTTHNLHLLDSSSNDKLSFHVATPLVLATASDVSTFSHWMRYTFDKCDEPLAPLLDCSVYATCGNMRLPLNRKPAKPGAATAISILFLVLWPLYRVRRRFARQLTRATCRWLAEHRRCAAFEQRARDVVALHVTSELVRLAVAGVWVRTPCE
jgi:hypothetical protein